MKQRFTMILLVVFTLFGSFTAVQASEERLSVSDLPFSGYYITVDDNAVDGLVFEDNQLYIYLTDSHSHLDEDSHSHEENLPGQEFIDFLEELHSFPHPDLKNYNEDVREVYLEEDNLPYDLQSVYEEIADLITPEMSQTDIQNLINNRVPGIYYTEKNGYQYYTIASPMVFEADGRWEIDLFGNQLYTFTMNENGTQLEDQNGVVYDYVSGIRP